MPSTAPSDPCAASAAACCEHSAARTHRRIVPYRTVAVVRFVALGRTEGCWDRRGGKGGCCCCLVSPWLDGFCIVVVVAVLVSTPSWAPAAAGYSSRSTCRMCRPTCPIQKAAGVRTIFALSVDLPACCER